MGVDEFCSNEQLSQNWMQIYDEQNFPFDVRYQLDDWLMQIPWDDFKRRGDMTESTELYGRLIQELEKKMTDTTLDRLKILQLKTAKNKLKDQFEARPSELVDVMQICFNRERLLLESMKAVEDRQATEEDEELLKYRQQETEIRQLMSDLKLHTQKLDVDLEEFHDYMQTTVPLIKDYHDRLTALHREANKQNANTNPQKVNNEIKGYSNEINKLAAIITQKKTVLTENLRKGAEAVSRGLHMSWRLIQHYKLQQKQSVCYLSKPPEGAVDTLNKVCEETSRQLKAYLFYNDKLLSDVKRLQYPQDNERQILEQLQKELDVLLGQHLQQIFLVTKQPPNVQKIVSKKSPSLVMCVRLLGGLGLGIEHSLPTVSVRVYAEQQLKEALEAEGPTIEGLCKTVENGSSRMELKRATSQIMANLNNVQLRGVNRLEKQLKDDRVTEHKYGMVFYTKVNVCNKLYPLKELSLPIVLTSQTSQNGAAKGTLIWDAAFSKPDRQIYDDEGTVPWPKVEEVLRAMFKETGRTLDQDQLNYIARYIFRSAQPAAGVPEDFSTCQLTKERFLRDKVPGRDFTFWRWIYACKNLIENHVSKEWTDNIIYGFIGKQESERLLDGMQPGTFLLRYRERKLEDSQRAQKCACLALAVVGRDPHTGQTKIDHVKDHLTPTDIHKYSLTRILNSLVDVQTKEPLLQTLYPERDFQTLVQKYLPDSGEASDGYNPTRLLIGVHRNGRGDDDSCSENAMSPNPMSPGEISMPSTPDFLSEDLQNIHPFEPQVPLDQFLTDNGSMLMISTEIDIPIDPCIPTTVCDLEDGSSQEGTLTPT